MSTNRAATHCSGSGSGIRTDTASSACALPSLSPSVAIAARIESRRRGWHQSRMSRRMSRAGPRTSRQREEIFQDRADAAGMLPQLLGLPQDSPQQLECALPRLDRPQRLKYQPINESIFSLNTSTCISF